MRTLAGPWAESPAAASTCYPSPAGPVRLAAVVLLLALCPAVGTAQAAAQYPAQQGTATSSAATAAAGSGEDRADRILVIDCPVRGEAGPTAGMAADADSTTRALVAALCSRGTPPATAATIRHLLTVPRDVTNTAREEPGEHGDHDDGIPSARAAEPQFRVHLFADVKFSAMDSTGARNGFALGQFDLFGQSQLSDRLSVLTEATLTALPRNTYSARLERILVTYWASDRFAASAGRYHANIGYYNSAFHHGSWFQTAVGRPLVFAIDGDIGLLPIHTLGVSATGDLPSGGLGLRYVAELGSGRAGQSSAATPPQPGLADNNTPSVNVALVTRPARWDGLQMGVSLYRDRLTLQDTSKAPIDELIGAAHALYKTDEVELLGEWVAMRHHSRAGGKADMTRGWYAQASRRFRAVRPYARYDYVDVPTSDELFGFLGRRSGPTGGVRWDFEALAAFKVQASHLQQTTRPTMNRVDAQVSFMF
jgi:hypothetical protein